MIIIEYPSLRPKLFQNVVEFGKHKQQQQQPHYQTPGVRTPTSKDIEKAKTVGCSPEEVVRRDNIVRQMWLQTHFHVGEDVIAKTEANRKKYGRLHIRGILKSYHEFHANEPWPEDDEPYIISLDSELAGPIICTADFITRTNNGGTC